MAVQLIKMYRDDPAHADGPTTADVHPEEAESMQMHGWRVADSVPSSKPLEAEGGDPEMGNKPKPRPRPKG